MHPIYTEEVSSTSYSTQKLFSRSTNSAQLLRRLANVWRKQNRRRSIVRRVRHDRVPVLDEGVAHHIQVLRLCDVTASQASNAVTGQVQLSRLDLLHDSRVAQGERLNVLLADGADAEVERVDLEALACELDGRDV